MRTPAASWQMRLPLPLMLALRYLWGGRRDAYVVFLSILAIFGIMLGVAALILVLAGLSGLQSFLRSDVLARTPHIEIEIEIPTQGGIDTVPPQGGIDTLCRDLGEIDGVDQAQRILRGRGWLLFPGGAVAVRAVGYEGRLPRTFPGADPPPAAAGQEETGGAGLYVGENLATTWGIQIGDLVEIVSPRPTLTPFGPQPRAHKLRLSGTFRTGRTEEDEHRIALPLAVARRLFGDHESRIEVWTASFDEALRVAERLGAVLPPGSRVRTWKDLNRALFFALKLEKMLMFVAVFLIVPVAGMALITVLALLISSKRGEIGMLLAMGARPRELRRTFLLLGSLLGAIGLGLGVAIGVGSAWLLDRYKIISPPGDVYFLEHLPFSVEVDDLLLVVLSTVSLIAVSTFYAARRAGALRPIEALRI